MADTPPFAYEPSLPHGAAGVIHQTVTLPDADGEILATASWTNWPQQPGVVQLLHVEVRDGHRRRGHGTHVLEETVKQATAACRPLRRIVAMVNQPDTITRAFLQRRGFVHIHTLEELGDGEIEVMCLVRTFN